MQGSGDGSKLAASLRAAVEESLSFFATSNAVFLSEMLVRGEDPSAHAAPSSHGGSPCTSSDIAF